MSFSGNQTGEADPPTSSLPTTNLPDFASGVRLPLPGLGLLKLGFDGASFARERVSRPGISRRLSSNTDESGFTRARTSRYSSARPAPGRPSASNIIARLQKPTLVLTQQDSRGTTLQGVQGVLSHRTPSTTYRQLITTTINEAYIPQRDIYIEKDSSINENIDRLRLAATSALVSREDVIIVASVSCIYGLGSPSDYKRMMVYLSKGAKCSTATACSCGSSISSISETAFAFERGRSSRARRHHRHLARRRKSSRIASSSSATRSTHLGAFIHLL